ncbi:MAG: gamma carbonic anhydrase family protein [Chloroflexi bacterium]|nr:gamma carbonic anhydrase family protein [Chloroflexota bacterium]
MLIPFGGKSPRLGENVFIAPGAYLIGDVSLGDNTNIWFGAVIRGDLNPVVLGSGCTVQDNCVIHVSGKEGGGTYLGNGVTVGHGAVLEGCRVGDNAVLGMNSVVLPGAVIGENVMLAAGAVVLPGQEIPPGCLAAGTPAVPKKEISGDSLERVKNTAARYVKLASRYIEDGIGSSGRDHLSE